MNQVLPRVIFENDDYLLLDKPSGLLVHADGRSEEPTLADWLLKERGALRGVGEPMRLQSGIMIERPGIVHRIDQETSGILVVAKTPPAFLHLKEEFKNRRVHKEYRAFVYGVVSAERDVIERPIGRSARDFRLYSAQRGAKGALREARTSYRVLRRGKEASELSVVPLSGRTHQIRVHLKAINHPVVCDRLYAPKRAPLLGLTRLALHAWRLSFRDARGVEISGEAPLPIEFVEASKAL